MIGAVLTADVSAAHVVPEHASLVVDEPAAALASAPESAAPAGTTPVSTAALADELAATLLPFLLQSVHSSVNDAVLDAFDANYPSSVPAPVVDDTAAHAVQQLAGALDALRSDLSGQLAEVTHLANAQSAMVEKLHADNQALRVGGHSALLAPIIRGVMRISDLAGELASHDASGDAAVLAPQLVLLLEDLGLEPFTPEHLSTFDATRCTGRGTAATTDAAQDNTVASVRKCGYMRGDSVFRPAEVVVYRFSSPHAVESTLGAVDE